MICEHKENKLGDKCFIAKNGWDEPCQDCPCPNKVKEFLKTPGAKVTRARAKQLIKRIKEQQLKKSC